MSQQQEIDWQEGRITEEALAYMRSFIGQRREVQPWNSQVTRDAIWHFALGLGDDNPMWWDKEYAQNTRWGRMIAPPAFLYSCSSGGRYFQDDERAGGVEEFLPGCLGVWAADRWHWNRPAYLGEEIKPYAELHDVREIPKSTFGGRSVAQTGRTAFYGDNGELIAEHYQTVLRFERRGTRTQGRYADRRKPVYSEEAQRKIAEQYEREPGQRRGAEPRYWEDVQPGDVLGPLVKGPLTITNLAGWLLGWGSPLCPTNRIAYHYLRQHPGGRLYDDRYGVEDTLEGAHWDEYFANMSGFPDGYDFGCQRVAWASHLLTDWHGDDGFITDMDVQLRRPNFLGDTTWLSGKVMAKREEAGTHLVDCALQGINQDGHENLRGSATIRLPKKSA